MSDSDIDLASFLCSRLCHDLLSPIGALNNGLELLADETDPEMRQRCLDLLADSARMSAQKLKYFRLAFGAAGGFGEMVDSQEPRALIAALVEDKPRVTLEWAVGSDQLPKPAVKVLLNLALIGLDALVRGGQLMVGAEFAGGRSEIAVRAAGAKVVVDETIARALTGDLKESELGPRTAAAHMVQRIAADHDGEIQIVSDGEQLVIGATLAV